MPFHKIFLLVPGCQDAGLTSAALGLVRALQQEGLKVGFAKPIGQPHPGAGSLDPSTAFARSLCQLDPPASVPLDKAEDMVRAGAVDALMEDVVALVEGLRADHDAVVVEGLVAGESASAAMLLNTALHRSLGAELIPVVTAARHSARTLGQTLHSLARHYGSGEAAEGCPPFAGVLVNKVPAEADGSALRQELEAAMGGEVPVLALIPFEPTLHAPRLQEVSDALALSVEHAGTMAARRVSEVVVAARAVENVIDRMRPGALIVTPADRSDVALAAALASLNGIPLAGLVLTCGGRLPDPVRAFMAPALAAGLPVLRAAEDTYDIAALLARLDCHVGADDTAQMEQVIRFIADRIDCAPLQSRVNQQGDGRMSPPAFRHRLVRSAQAADRRIVLPEGEEPRTIQAAIQCSRKRIARCVLLGDRDRIAATAGRLGLTLPPDLEILDPPTVRARYVTPMLALRRSKGLTLEQAQEQLADSVVLGTMMLATGDVDGLVSGAVHTTADTVRPALQLIKTKAGCGMVSSVFMLMPDQVLVYGDCAINPDPTAEQLAAIAIQSADSAKAFGIEPRVAMISYSTGTSGSGVDVEKVRAATRLAQALRPDLTIDGPMQYDAASVEAVGRQKAPDSPVAGRANVFVFPDLNTGNTTYKAVQRSANVVSVGPMLQGLRKPVNDLSRGALVDDIVYTIALTAIQAAPPAEPPIALEEAL